MPAQKKVSSKLIGELRSEEKDLRGIINPQEQHDERACGAIRRTNGAFSKIKAERKLPDCEEHCGKKSADPDIMPSDFRIRQELEYHREEQGDEPERKSKVYDVGKRLHSGKHAPEPLCHKSNPCGKKKGNQKQESNYQDKAKGEDPIPQNAQGFPSRASVAPPKLY